MAAVETREEEDMSHRTASFIRALALAAIVAVVGWSGAMAEDSWRMATKMPPESPEGQLFQKFADLVKEYTHGELTIQVFPSEQLGQAEAVLEQLSAGTVHIYAEDADYLAKWVPDMSYMSSPFVFASRDHWLRFIKTDLVKGWLDQARQASGITEIGDLGPLMRGPYRVLVSKRPVASLDDLKGLKLRMYDDELAVDIWSYLGADVRVIGWSDVYQSIQSGIIEGVTSPVALVESMKFYEVAPNIERTNEYFQANALLVNEKAYNALPAEQRDALVRAYNEIGAMSQELMAKVTDESLARMKKKGVTYSEIDTGPFVEKMRLFYEQKAKDGKLPKGFFEAVEASRPAS